MPARKHEWVSEASGDRASSPRKPPRDSSRSGPPYWSAPCLPQSLEPFWVKVGPWMDSWLHQESPPAPVPRPDAAQLLCPLPRGCGPAWLDHQPWEGGEHLFVRTPCLPGAPHLPGHLHTLHTRKQARRGGHSCVGCTAARTPSGPLWQPFPLGRWLSQRQCLGGGTLPRGQALPDPEKDSGRPWAGVDVNVGRPQGWALRGGLWSPHC